MFAAPELELSSLFAVQASDLLGNAAVDVSLEELSRQLQSALRGRDLISQARGVLMERHGVSADAAYTMLRRSSRQSSTPVRARAQDVVSSTQPPGDAP